MPTQKSKPRKEASTDLDDDLSALTLGAGAAEREGRAHVPARPHYGTIVFAKDGRPGTDQAAGWARGIAKSHHSRIVVTTVYRPPSIDYGAVGGLGLYPGLPAIYEGIRENLVSASTSARDAFRADGIDAESVLLDGSPTRAISNVAASEQADLIILGSHGDKSRPALGSVGDRLPERVDTSVLIARTQAPPRHILAATDGSHASYRAVAHALQLASDFDAQLTVQHVLEHPEEAEAPSAGLLRDAIGRMDLSPPPRVSYRLDAGKPAEEILRRATAENIDLIVMGSRGLGHIKGLFLGSVSRRVLNHATASILLVKAPDDA